MTNFFTNNRLRQYFVSLNIINIDIHDKYVTFISSFHPIDNVFKLILVINGNNINNDRLFDAIAHGFRKEGGMVL